VSKFESNRLRTAQRQLALLCGGKVMPILAWKALNKQGAILKRLSTTRSSRSTAEDQGLLVLVPGNWLSDTTRDWREAASGIGGVPELMQIDIQFSCNWN